MQVTSIHSNTQVPATAPLPQEAPVAASEETVGLTKDALVQSTEAPAEKPAPAKPAYDWAPDWFNLYFLSFFQRYFKFSSNQEKEQEEARVAKLEQQNLDRQLSGRRQAVRRLESKSFQAHLAEGFSTVKAVDQARKFHEAVDQLTQRPREAQA